MNSARGILLPHLFCQAGQHGFQTRQIDDDSLNSCVIYWDKIACPTNNFVHVALRDEDTLIREGLLLRPKTIITGSIYSGEMVDQTAQWQAEIFRDLDRIQPGFWSFGDTSPENLAQTSEFTDARTALVTLVKSLPLPQNSVPMDNIIEFKSKRLPELHRLRHALDGIYLKIADHRDQKLSLQYEIEELDKACADTIKVSKEWWKGIKLADLKSILTVSTSAAAAAWGLPFSMPTAAAIGGSAAAAISVAHGIHAKLKSNRKLPFWYASEVSRKL